MPLVVAHRGASAEAPENTMAAFRLALEQQADMIELDVRLSLDGQLVVSHDSSLRRTTGVGGRVETSPLEALQALDAGGWFDTRFRGEIMPRLTDVLALIEGRAGLDVELKVRSAGRADMAATVARTLHPWSGRIDLVVSSFDEGVIEQFRRLSPVPACCINSRRVTAGWTITEWTRATPGLIDRSHRQGGRVMVWTVDDPGAMRALAALGVDAICTNRPALARRILSEEPV